MDINSLMGTFRSRRFVIRIGTNSAHDRMSIEGFLLFICFFAGFFACLNYDFFERYYYGSMGFYVNVGCILIAWIIQMMRSRMIVIKEDIPHYVFIIVSLAYCVFDIIFITGGGFRYIGCVVNMMLLPLVVKHCHFSRKSIKVSMMLIFVILIYASLSVNDYFSVSLINSDETVNSNYYAFMAVTSLIYFNYFAEKTGTNQGWKGKFLCLVVDAISLYIIMECQSRGSLVAWVVYMLFAYVVPKRLWDRPKKRAMIAGLIIVGGVVGSYIYIKYIVHMDLLILGRDISTRNRLWSHFFTAIENDWTIFWFGEGTSSFVRQQYGYGMHSVYLGIWNDIGLVGFIIFFSFIVWSIARIRSFSASDRRNREESLLMAGIFSLMVFDYFSIAFTGPLAIWSYFILGMALGAQKPLTREMTREIERGS